MANFDGGAITSDASALLLGHTDRAIRLIKAGRRDWSLAILVLTKRMTRRVSDVLRKPVGNVPPIPPMVAVNMEGQIFAAEIIAFLLQKLEHVGCFDEVVELMCSHFHGRSGSAPAKGGMDKVERIRGALAKWNECFATGRRTPGNSVLASLHAVHQASAILILPGDPDADWVALRGALDTDSCQRLYGLAKEVRNVQLLERGAKSRQRRAQDWRDTGGCRNAPSSPGCRSRRSISRRPTRGGPASR